MSIHKRILINLAIAIVLVLSVFLSQTNAQTNETIDLNTMQHFVVFSPGFYPFSGVANNEVKSQIPTNPLFDLAFNNIMGNCTVAAAADFAEFGNVITLNGQAGNDLILIDFGPVPPGVTQFGLSFVPTGSCEFDLFVTAHVSSTSSGDILSGPPANDTFIPNGISVLGGFLPDNIVSQISNENNNPQCQNSPFGINPLVINGSGGNDVLNGFLNTFDTIPQRKADNLSNKTEFSESQQFTLTIPENRDKSKTVYNQKLSNTTDMTRIFVTGIFPSLSEENTIMIGRIIEEELEVTLMKQVDPALAAVQHAIISATMPYQLSKPNGFFITQGGGCVGPYCVIVEQGMIVVDPDGACTPDKLNKRKAGYKTFNPSMFFDPFPVASQTIQIPAKNIVDPKNPLVSKVVQENAYYILQPVPPGAMLIQQLKLGLEKDDN